MNRRFIGLGLAIASASLVMAGCTSPQTAPSSSASANSAAKVDLSAIKVALVPGGAHQYFQPWKVGGADAVKEFGIGGFTFNETGEWDQTKQNNAINALGAQGYNAFGIFGVSATDINATFENLNTQGFATGSLASCPAGTVNKAQFCLSTDTETAAYTAAKATIDAMGGKGNLVHLTGQAVDTNTQRRIKGVEKAVAETNGAVKLLTTVTDIDKDLQSAQKAVSDLLATKGKDIQGIVTSAGNPAVAAAEAIPQSGLKIAAILTDDDPIVLKAISAGGINGTVVQNPYGQAYVGTWALANIQAGNCTVKTPGVIVDSKSFVVTKANTSTYDEERKAATKEILKKFQDEILDCKA